MRLTLTLRALFSHWRRKPFQLLALLLGLAVATALWSGVQALNAEARQSYDRAARLLGNDRFTTLEARGGGDLAQQDYIALRRAGWRVSPVIEGRLTLGDRRYRLIGIEPLTLPPGALGGDAVSGATALTEFLTPPYRVIAAPETAMMLPDTLPKAVTADVPPDTLITDIGVAQRLLGHPGRVSRLILAPEQKASRAPLDGLTQTPLVRVAPQDRADIGGLTESFHLNLTAFGLLSFVVGLFIVHATIGLAFEQRRPLLRTLRALGVPQRALMAALVVELVTLATLAGLAGIVLGYLIAAALLPGVAASLGGLYGAAVPGSLSLSPLWWLAGLGMSLAGALIAAASSLWKAHAMPILAPVGTEAWLGAERRQQRAQLALAGLTLTGTALVFFLGEGLVAGFALMGGVLMGAALVLPSVLGVIVGALARRATGVRAQWFWADTRAQLGGLSLALMALLLALSVNIGVGTMVNGFRATFLGWLDQRLAAEVYLTGSDDAQAAAIADYLQTRPEVTALLPIWNTQVTVRGWPVAVYGFADHATYRDNWPLIAQGADVWDRVAAGEAALISEQMARRFDLWPGDTVTLPAPEGGWSLPVAAVYSDYGNTTGQMMVALPELLARWPEVEKRRYGLRVTPDAVPALIEDLVARFGLGERGVVDQARLKGFSRAIFETTFAVTVALNALTLAVAGLALLTSLLTLAGMRLPQLAPVWAMGVTRGELGLMELWRALALALVTALLAIPLGLGVAWILTAVINVQAFGWKLPLMLFPGQWLHLTGLALLTAALATVLPVLRLRRTPPVTLLRLFSDER